MTTSYSFHTVPARDFPFSIECRTMGDDELVFSTVIETAGAMEIPALVEKHGPVRVKFTYASGRSEEFPPR